MTSSSTTTNTGNGTSGSATTTSKDDDVAFWLHNKLGSHADLWSSVGISSTLTQDHLASIKSIYWSLDTLVKVKLLLSFIHLPKRNITEWEMLLKDIVELSQKDDNGDQWIAVISEIMKTFPDKAQFNVDLSDKECEGFSAGMQELRKTVKKNNDTTHLPLESCYLGKSALKLLTGDIPNPSKCFSLIRKAKSARFRQELLEKGAQTSKTKKTSDYAAITGSRRSVDDHRESSSLNPVSRQSSVGFLKSSTISSTSGISGTARLQNRREGNVKLLSLEEEQALNDKKRKKTTLDDDESTTEKKSSRSKKTHSQQLSIDRMDSSTGDDLLSLSSATTTKESLNFTSSDNVESFTPTTPQITQAPYVPLSLNEMPATPNPVMNHAANDLLYGLHNARIEQNYAATVPSSDSDRPTTTTSPIRTDLRLTTEQIEFARDLFRSSTCLTRADKSRILGFIAGARDRTTDSGKPGGSNPVVTIKLSEKDEIIADPNTGQPQQYFAETFFQMNTSTGEWKRIKKLRPVNPMT